MHTLIFTHNHTHTHTGTDLISMLVHFCTWPDGDTRQSALAVLGTVLCACVCVQMRFFYNYTRVRMHRNTHTALFYSLSLHTHTHTHAHTHSLSLSGDLAHNCAHLIPEQVFHGFLTSAILPNLDPVYAKVCQNAAWSLGEFAVGFQEGLKPHIEGIAHKVAAAYDRFKEVDDGSRRVDNLTIALGKVALVCPEQVVCYFHVFGRAWLDRLAHARETDKGQAYRGLMQMGACVCVCV
jgi:hypothetical protein